MPQSRKVGNDLPHVGSVRSKQGRETTEQIMAAIGGVENAVDNMTLRVDRIVENQSGRPGQSGLTRP